MFNQKKKNKAQKWFNKKYSKKKESINDLNISDKEFDNSLKIDGFTKLKTIDLTILKLTSLKISNCSKLEVFNCHNNRLTSLDISNCPKLKNPEKADNFITTSNPNLIISKEGEEARNLLIVGRTGGGKSTLSNVLSSSTEFNESD